MSNINVEAIIRNHLMMSVMDFKRYIRDNPLIYQRMKDALKETIEEVINLCAKEAQTVWEPDVSVKKESILKVKTMISYDNN